MTTSAAPVSLRARTRRALGTAALVPAFLAALALGPFERKWTWPRAITVGVVCELAALGLVLVTR